LNLPLGVDLTLSGDRQNPRDVALGLTEAGGVVQLAGGVLEAQPEQLTACRGDLLGQLHLAEVLQF
jgi:hypothetical protein